MRTRTVLHLALVVCLVALAAIPVGAVGAGETTAAGPVTISVFGKDASAEGITLKDGLAIWKEIEKKLNVKFNWQTTLTWYDVVETRLNAGIGLEDIYTIGYTSPSRYIDAGLFVPLDDLINKHGPAVKKFIQKYPLYRAWNTYPKDGKMYFMSETTYLTAEENDLYPFFARLDWLQKLGKKAPATTDDLYSVMVAVKNTDLNGNGKADEVPLCPSDSPQTTIRALSAAFGLHGLYNDWVFPNASKNIVMEVATEEYKNLLMFLNKLYREGLLDPQFESIKNNQVLKQNMATNRVAFWDMAIGSYLSYTDTIIGGDPNAKVVALAPISSAGVKPFMERGPTEWKRWAITKFCKTPDVAMKVLDYCFDNDEGRTLRMYGILGDTYTMVNAKPQFTDKILKAKSTRDAKQGLGMDIQCLPMFYAPLTEGEKQRLGPDILSVLPTLQSHLIPQSYFVARLIRTSEQEKKLAKADLDTYITESLMKFITGKTGFDKWADYTQQLKALGLDEMQATYQEIYNQVFK